MPSRRAACASVLRPSAGAGCGATGCGTGLTSRSRSSRARSDRDCAGHVGTQCIMPRGSSRGLGKQWHKIYDVDFPWRRSLQRSLWWAAGATNAGGPLYRHNPYNTQSRSPPREPLRLPPNSAQVTAEKIGTVIGIVGATAAKATKPG